jgi:hypothetical protein
MSHLLTWMTFFPILGVIAIAFTPKAKETLIKSIAGRLGGGSLSVELRHHRELRSLECGHSVRREVHLDQLSQRQLSPRDRRAERLTGDTHSIDQLF